MKAKQPILRRNLHKIFCISIVLSAVFYITQTSNGYQLVNSVMSWISDTINGGDFSKPDGNMSALRNDKSYNFAEQDSVFMFSNYEYDVVLAENTTNNTNSSNNIAATVNTMTSTLAFEAEQPEMMLASGVYSELAAGMSKSQSDMVAGLTSNMSRSQIVSRLKEDRSFRQSMQNAAGSSVNKEMYLQMAASYK